MLVPLGGMVRVIQCVGGVPGGDEVCRVLDDLRRPGEHGEREHERKNSGQGGHDATES